MRGFFRGILSFADKILPLAFWLVLMFGFDKPYVVFITLLSALVHEMGHLTAILLVSGKGRMRTDVSGFRIRLEKALSYKEERLVYAMGPLFNLFFGFISLFLFCGKDYLTTFGVINIATGVCNLIPLEGYDGHRIIISYLRERQKSRAEGAAEYLSLALSASLSVISMLLFEYLGVGIWMFGLFFISLCSKIKKML